MKKVQIFIGFVLILTISFQLIGQFPTVYFNKVYRSTGTGYSTSTNSITVGSKISGSNFKFVAASSSTLAGQFNGNDIAGNFSYFDATGNLIQIGNGTISRLGGGSGKTWYFYLVIPSTGYAYLLVNPQYDANVSDAGGSFNTNSSGVQTDLNAFLSSQSVISVTASISPFTTCINSASTAQSFWVSGSNLSADIKVKAPTNFQVSTSSNSGFVDSLTLTKSGTSISSTAIYVRLKSLATANTYSGDVTASSANAGTQFVNVSGIVYDPPTITSQPSNSSVCSGNATSFSVSATGSNLSYKWQVSTDGTNFSDISNSGIYTGATTAVLRLSSGLTSSYSGYKYQCIISGSCSPAVTSNSATLTVNAAPTITAQPSNSTICAGTATSFSVSASGTNLTYQWQKKTVGGAFTNITNGGIYSNATTNTLNISSSVTASENGVQYQCIISGSCSPSVTSNAVTITVNAIPAAPVSISGPTTICLNTVQTYAVTHNDNVTFYTWTKPSGWSGSSTNDYINLTSQNISETVTIKVSAGNSCGSSSETSLSVTVNNSPAPIISFTKNTNSQCLSGNSFTFTSSVTNVSGVSVSAYSWNYGDNSSIETTANGSHTYASANSYDVKLTVTASNGCTTSFLSDVTVNAAPTSSLTGTTSICNGSSAALATSLTGTSPWNLSYSDGSNTTTLTGITNPNYIFNVSPSSTKTYTITSLSDANCTTALASNLTGSAAITVNSNVTASVSITSSDADNTFCSGTSVTFTATPVNGGSPTYAWLKNGIAISGATNSTYNSTGLADFDVISVQMTASSQTCLVNNQVYSNEISNRVAPGAPRTPASITGLTSQCAGVGAQSYSIAEVLNATSYTWTLPTGWSIESGQSTTSLSVTIGSTTQTGDITVTASNGCGTSTAQFLTIGTINASPTISSTSAGSRCGTGTVSLGATASSGTISWFTSLTGGSASTTGTSYTTPSISSTTTYYVSTSNGTCTSSPRTAIVATINEIPSVTSTSPSSRCGTGTVNLGATASAGTISWYASITGGSAISTGSSYTTGSLSTTTTYYVDATNNGCTTGSRTAIDATIKSIPTIATNTPGARCGSGTIALAATASAGTINWYSNSTGGSSLATGTSFTTPNISITTTYYIDATSDGCTTASRTSITATINAIPSIDSNTPASRCGTGTVTLGATGSAGSTLNWFSVATAGSSLGTGTSFTTPSISTSTTYYVEATTSSCTSGRTAIIATINTSPTVSSSSGASRCGTGSVTLSATASAGDLKWYDASTNGTLLATATSYSPSISSTTTYYVEANDGTCASSRTAIIGTVTPIPTITASTGASLCVSGTATISATTSNGTIKWYDANTNGNLLSSGSSYTTPSVSSTTTYYAEAVDGSCVSASRTAVTVSFGSINITIAGNTTDYDVVSLTASGGTSYAWDGGNSTNSAANTFDESGTYTVSVSDGSGCSGTKSVVVTVKLRGLNKYGDLVDVKNKQINQYGEEGSNNPVLNTGLVKSYSKNLQFYIDASNFSSFSGTGTTWKDLSTNGISTTLTNGPSYSSNNGGTFTFDGINDYVLIPSAYPGSSDITIEAWVNPASVSSSMVIANMDNWSTGYVHFQFIGNRLQFALNSEPDKYSNYTFTANSWYHVAAVYDKSAKTIKFYVNGSLTNTENYSNPPRIANQTFTIGAWKDNSNFSRYFNGSISLVRMYGTTLSSNQIATNFNNTKQKFGL